jgi:hypothetical protein
LALAFPILAEPTFFFCCCFSLAPLHRLDGFLPSSNVVVPVPGVVGINVVLLLLSFDIMDVQVRLPVYLNMLLQLQAVCRMNELSVLRKNILVLDLVELEVISESF